MTYSLRANESSGYARGVSSQREQAFEDCMNDPSPIQRVAEGKRLAAELNVRGTPTLIINGWQLAAPTYEELENAVSRIFEGRDRI
jgi:protein-disulfide isomerase